MIEAYGYLRVSGKSQLDGDGFLRQRLAIERYAPAVGLKIVGWYEERAVEGATEWEDRPAWVDMVSKLNGVRTIVIEKLDRLARDLMVQEHIIADLGHRHIELHSTMEPDLGSKEPTRVMMRQIMGAIAQYDKSMIVLRLRGARQRMKASTGRCEGRKPYGYYEAEKPVLAEIQSRRGHSPAQIAWQLNGLGLLNRSGKPWHPTSIERILRKA